MKRPFRAITPTHDEVTAARAGDDLIAHPDAVMDRAFTVHAPQEEVWPWLVQLGKNRAGWYLPTWLERLLPRSNRATHAIDPAWQDLQVGNIIPDYGGRDETFEMVTVDRPTTLVYKSRRKAMNVTWSITLTDAPHHDRTASGTRIHLRLRLGPVRRRWLVATAGEFIDLLTIAGMAAGLQVRLRTLPPAN